MELNTFFKSKIVAWLTKENNIPDPIIKALKEKNEIQTTFLAVFSSIFMKSHLLHTDYCTWTTSCAYPLS